VLYENWMKQDDAVKTDIQEGSQEGLQEGSLDMRGRRLVLLLGSASLAMLLVAGGLLWWRDGERLFTEGLISAIARCF
jgi:uncharacterized iron-regulated membrane protein